MCRIHERPVLYKNFKTYYKACENFINLSKLNKANMETIEYAFGPQMYEKVTNNNVLGQIYSRTTNEKSQITFKPL